MTRTFTLKAVLLLCLGTAVVVGVVSYAAFNKPVPDFKTERQSLQQQIDSLDKDNKQKDQDLQDEKTLRESIEVKLTSLETRNRSADAKVLAAVNDLRKAQSRADSIPDSDVRPELIRLLRESGALK
jgi:septal ring factor EnvC (AmiA/AmiB activator)